MVQNLIKIEVNMTTMSDVVHVLSLFLGEMGQDTADKGAGVGLDHLRIGGFFGPICGMKSV